MPQTYETVVSGTTTFGALYGKINNLAEALRSAFSGTSFPTTPTPVEGQFCYRTDEDKLYIYRNTAWEEIPLSGTLWQEIINARGTKPSIDQRLDVAINEDGTLKAATSLNPSQWYKPSLTFTYISTTSFKVNGDQTDIYKPTRRLKINITGSTVYSEVVSASYSAPDTTVQIYDAVLTSALIDVEHSLFLPTKDNGALSPGMLNEKIVSKTTTYTTIVNDKVVKCDASGGAFTVTVLAAATAGAGRRQTFKKTDTSANAVTINCGFNIVLSKYGETVEIISDGSSWLKITDFDNYLVNADIFSDFVVSGLLGTDPGALLTMTIPGGTAYVMGKRVVKSGSDADLTKTYTASKDTYVDISNTGAITYSEVANGAAAPAVAANSIRLQKVVTNGTEITGVTDLRVLVPKVSAHGKTIYANNYVLSGTDTYTLDIPGYAAYAAGDIFFSKIANANTVTNPSLNISSLGAKAIKKEGGAALAVGDMPVNHEAIFRYNGTDAILLNPKSPALTTKILHVRDEKASGTQGGTNSAGSQVRTLNTVVTNEITGASLSTNQIILPAGTYRIRASAPAGSVGGHKAKLYNATTSADVIIGTSKYTNANYVSTLSLIIGQFTIASVNNFEIRHYTESLMTDYGLGRAVTSGEVEVYTEVFIEKI